MGLPFLGTGMNTDSERASEGRHTETIITENQPVWSQDHSPGLNDTKAGRGASQDGRVMVERSDRMWPTGEGNGRPLQ